MPLPTHPLREWTRPALAIGAAAVAMLGLAGCIKATADVTIAPDATASGTFAFELQKDAAGFLGITSVDDFAAQLDDGELSQEEGLQAFTECAPSESDTGFVYTCSFTDTAFTDPGGPWTITAEDSAIAFRMANEAPADQVDTLGLGEGSMGSITVDVAFPGTITSLTGEGVQQTSDTTATIKASITTAYDVTIRSEDGSGGLSVASLLVVVVAIGVIVLLVVVVFVLAARRRGQRHPELPAGEDQPPAIDPS